jgi:hypothetical protein
MADVTAAGQATQNVSRMCLVRNTQDTFWVVCRQNVTSAIWLRVYIKSRKFNRVPTGSQEREKYSDK